MSFSTNPDSPTLDATISVGGGSEEAIADIIRIFSIVGQFARFLNLEQLQNIKQSIENILVLGSAGSGKTTFFQSFFSVDPDMNKENILSSDINNSLEYIVSNDIEHFKI